MEKKHDEFKVRDEFYAKAKAARTAEDVSALLTEVAAFDHDYGTCVYGVAAAMLAAGEMMSRRLGITGFQASCVRWEILQQWEGLKGPMKLMRYENMLYPQYEHDFGRTIDSGTAAWLKDEARKRLSEENSMTSPRVVEHWKKLAAGKVPFGYEVAAE